MLKALLSALAISEIRTRVNIAVHNGIVGAVAALLSLVAFGFLVAALFLALTYWMGPLLACVVLAVLFLIVAGIVYGAGRRKTRRVGGPGRAAMMGALGGSVAASAEMPDAPPPPPRPPRRTDGGIMSKIPGGPMTLLPVAAFVAALLAARRRP